MFRTDGTISNNLMPTMYYPITSQTDFIQEIVLPLGTAPQNYVSAKHKKVQMENSLLWLFELHKEWVNIPVHAPGDQFHPSGKTSQLYGWFIYFT